MYGKSVLAAGYQHLETPLVVKHERIATVPRAVAGRRVEKRIGLKFRVMHAIRADGMAKMLLPILTARGKEGVIGSIMKKD